MKKNIYKLSFEEANTFLNFPVEDTNNLQKVKESYYVIQNLLIKSDWINLVKDRFSWLFIRDLIEINIKFNSKLNLTKYSILDEIKHLEKPDCFKSITGKPKLMSEKGFFKGLMHKHYYDDSPKGLSKNLMRNLTKKTKRKALEADLSKLTEEKKTNLRGFLSVIESHLLLPFMEGLEGEGGDNCLTGEWIIFFEQNNTKYYLALWGHDLDDSIKAEQIHKFCKVEYPELKILEHLNT